MSAATKGQNDQQKKYVGQPMDRVDGRLKVTGAAKYAAEFTAPGLACGVLVQSTIAKGKIRRIDRSQAERAPGILAVITHENMPAVAKPTVPPAGQSIPLFDPTIYFSGQNIGVVVAETFAQAEHAADLLQVEYETQPAEIDMEKRLSEGFAPKTGRPAESKRGDFEQGIASATTKVDQVYRTPVEHHNPMEPHATVAIWQDGKLTAFDATQGVVNSAQNLAEEFGLTGEDVRVIDPFVGGGFGCKGQSWPHSAITVMAAKVVGRPVRLELTRKQMFTSNGHRPETRQAATLGAGADGKLVAIQALVHNHTSDQDEFMEPAGGQYGNSYSCPNVHISHKLVRVDTGAPTYMRAPGESSGSFGIETAMDELAWALNIDPIDLRLRNYAEKDESSGKPWSSKSLKECYQKGADAFGWSKRNPVVGSMKDGRVLIGYGMATATYPANFRPCGARARMFADGSVVIQCATQDLGTGTYTILTQIAADALGVRPDLIRVEIADSHLPEGPGSGGSCSAASAGSAVMGAAQALKSHVISFATSDQQSPLANLGPQELKVEDGRVSAKQDPSKSLTFSGIMNRYGKKVAEQDAFTKPGIERGSAGGGAHQSTEPADKGKTQGYSMQGFGAQFCEVHVDPDTRMIRVARWVGAFALGTVLNEKTITSQLQGGIVWGIGMGLLEQTLADPHFARYVNTNLAEYHVPVNRDAPPIEILLIDEKDQLVSPVGAKGAGEIGITGAAAAIGNAIYHATGKRIRELPITLDKLL
jgi:xanthine dehydrogenase YagR molybdenum-binding subunit